MILLAIFTILQLLDIYTTHTGLSRGGRELNPVLAAMFKPFGHLPVLILWKSLVIGGLYYYIDELYMDHILTVLIAIYISVLVNNFSQMGKI